MIKTHSCTQAPGKISGDEEESMDPRSMRRACRGGGGESLSDETHEKRLKLTVCLFVYHTIKSITVAFYWLDSRNLKEWIETE